MDIKDDKLIGENVVFKALNEKQIFSNGLPNSIIIHYTAGSSDRSAINAMKSRGLSAHLVVDKDPGYKTTQLVRFNRRAIHAGKSSDVLGGKKLTSFNAYSIGIEIDNPGPISKVGGKYYTWYNKKRKANPLPTDKVHFGPHRNSVTKTKMWAKYPQGQIDTIYEICRQLCKHYPSIQYILGHEEISPGRKSDPGPAFPLDEMRETLFKENEKNGSKLVDPKDYSKAPGGDKSSNDASTTDHASDNGLTGRVTANTLNIRAGASQSEAKVAAPLKKGAYLEVLKLSSGWCKVNHYALIGWVSKDYVEFDNSDEDYDAVVKSSTLNSGLYCRKSLSSR